MVKLFTTRFKRENLRTYLGHRRIAVPTIHRAQYSQNKVRETEMKRMAMPFLVLIKVETRDTLDL